jgi:predicted alpha/beta hydrolase family esterase
MHFRMVNHLLGSFLVDKVAKEAAANIVGVFVVLVLDDTVPNVRHNTFISIVTHFMARIEAATHNTTVVMVKTFILSFKVELKDIH